MTVVDKRTDRIPHVLEKTVGVGLCSHDGMVGSRFRLTAARESTRPHRPKLNRLRGQIASGKNRSLRGSRESGRET